MASSLWFKHYTDSLTSNTKLKALVRKYGAYGYAAYYALQEHLYEHGGRPVSEFDAKSLARDLRMSPQKMIEILDYAAGADCDFLIQSTADGYESDPVCAAIKYNQKISKKRRAAGKAGAQKRWRDKTIAKEC